MIDLSHSFARMDYRNELADLTEDQKTAFLSGVNAVCQGKATALIEQLSFLLTVKIFFLTVFGVEPT